MTSFSFSPEPILAEANRMNVPFDNHGYWKGEMFQRLPQWPPVGPSRLMPVMDTRHSRDITALDVNSYTDVLGKVLTQPINHEPIETDQQ